MPLNPCEATMFVAGYRLRGTGNRRGLGRSWRGRGAAALGSSSFPAAASGVVAQPSRIPS